LRDGFDPIAVGVTDVTGLPDRYAFGKH